jgi:hypothetical protein
MPKTVANKKYFTFVAGLNTEAGPLTYPPNTWKEGTNIVPQINGSVEKRHAIDYEQDYLVSTATTSLVDEDNAAFSVNEWNAVAGLGTRNFKVVQRGATVYFYEDSIGSLSGGIKSFTINLNTFKGLGVVDVVGTTPISTTSTNGKLIIVGAEIDPILISYVESIDTITAQPIILTFRDFTGLDDQIAVDYRPPFYIKEHVYNLFNQGWSDVNLSFYGLTTGLQPSNAQSWYLGKDASGVFDPNVLDMVDFGTSPAPKGRFILNVFVKDRSFVSGVVGLPYEVINTRPTTCAFYGGRAWYAGINSDTVSSWVLFSQVAATAANYGKCYQDADPTSEVISNLVDSDGGIIPIQDAGTIVKLLPFGNSILVFADNGVWQISGDASGKFSASAYEVKRVSSIGCINPSSIVEAGQLIFYWSTDGIWVMQADQLGSFVLKNITNDTIQTAFQDIPVLGRVNSKGIYHTPSKTIYWSYSNDHAQDGNTKRFKKDSLLCLDLRLNSFYQLSISSLEGSSPYIVDLCVTKQTSQSEQIFNVISNGDSILANTATVTVPGLARAAEIPSIKFLTIVPNTTNIKVVFSDIKDSGFYDWITVDGVGYGYAAYIVTGDDLGRDQGGYKDVQGLYLISFMNRSETGIDGNGEPINPSSCLMQARWDWADNSVANKWNNEQQIYKHKRVWLPSFPLPKYDDGYPVVVTKSKIRGRGRAVSFKFTAEVGKDMQLVGWSVIFIGNSNV